MRITLAYVDTGVFPIPAGWTAVGHIDGGPAVLAYAPDRVPHSVQDGVATPLDPAEVNRVLVDAVATAALAIWPAGYTVAFPLAFGLNRRTTQPDRIARSGLHPSLLRGLGSAATSHDAPGLGALMSALALYADRHGQGLGRQEDLTDAEEAAGNALAILRDVRKGRTLQTDLSSEG